MKKLVVLAAALVSVAVVQAAGSVVEFDTTVTGDDIMWNDLSNWKVGGEQSPALPSSADAAKFTLNGAELTVNFPESTDITLANLWIYGPGKLTFKMPATSSIYIPTDNGNSGESAPGSGRTAMVVRNGALFTLDGGAITNATGSKYNYLLLSGEDTKVFVANGAKFAFYTRFPSKSGSAPAISDGTGNEIHVTGEGSELKLSGTVGGTRSKIVAENGGSVLGLPAAGSHEGLMFIVTNNATTAGVLYGSNVKAVFDGATLDSSTLSLEPGSVANFTWDVANSTVSLLSFYWGKQSCKSCRLNLTNSTFTASKYHQTGGRKDSGGNWLTSEDMGVVIRKGAVFHAGSTNAKTLSIGNYSTNDFIFVDGGTLQSDWDATICAEGSSNAIFKVRGETASAVFSRNLNFQNGSVLACEMPLPTDRPVMTCAGQVTLKDNVKYEVTVPKDFSQKTSCTLLTSAKTISGEIAPENVVVNGKATATVEKSADGKSILLTVKPAVGLMLLIR